MNSISTSILGDLGGSYGTPKPAGPKSDELGQEQFLNLMLTQFRNQNPPNPQDPTEFLSQLAQVTNVAGISEMKQSMVRLADSLYAGQALQAASVVGRNVLAPSDFATVAAGGGTSGAVDLPVSTQSGFIRITDATGALVREIPLGPRAAGLARFEWDGRTNAGQPVAAGTYTLAAGYRDGDQAVGADTYISKRVSSVALGGDGQRTEITTEDNQVLGLADVRAIY